MHAESYDLCREFVEQYLSPADRLQIADVGAYDVNGTYRPLFDRPNWTYVGLDVAPGPNVDQLLPAGEQYEIPRHLQGWFDVVISGQVLEHVRRPWRWFPAIASLAKPGGLIWITAPNTWEYHRYPIDCWRVWPDGMRALIEDAELIELACFFRGTETVAICRRPPCALPS